MRQFLRQHVAPYWRSVLVLLTPLLFLPLPVVAGTKEARCGYVILVMAAYWVTEALPVSVTALIPVFAFPLLGILSTGEVCIVYMKETNMMFLGGLTVAIAVEHCNLHRRIALRVILLVGQSPRALMAGFMFTTMFLSMWISNTATTAMMVPIVEAILAELYTSQETEGSGGTMEMDLAVAPPYQSQVDLVNPQEMSEKEAESMEATEAEEDVIKRNAPVARQMLLFSVMYSANIGGTGVITGTSPNLVLKAFLVDTYSEPTGLNFLTWMLFNVPGMLINVLLAWVWLQIRFLGLFGGKSRLADTVSPERKLAVKKLVQGKYRDLGPIRFQEVVVLTLFIILVLLWLFRAPEFITGWSDIFHETFGVEVDDATPAMLIVFLLFCLPAKLNFWCFRKPGDPPRDPKDKNEVLTWAVVQEKIPWGVVLLLGGGFAMAEASKQSGLSVWLGEQLYVFNGVNKAVIILTVTMITAMMTEVASNTATASILLPVLNELAINIQVNPLYLMLPAAVCCSYAFMLPVATPPNAIVFSVAGMKSSEMMQAGFVMNIVCVLVLNVMINTLGVAIFDLNTFPDWTNSTIVSEV